SVSRWKSADYFDANTGRRLNKSTAVKMITLMYRLTVFGVLSSCIRAQHDYQDADGYQDLFEERPFRPAYPRSSSYSDRRYPFQSRHDYEQGDCNSCKEIEDACSTYEDFVICRKPSVVYIAARCLHAEVECESSADVRMESEHGHEMAVGRRGILYAHCENGMWKARDAWNRDFVFNSLSCLPERAWRRDRGYVQYEKPDKYLYKKPYGTDNRMKVIRRCNFTVDMGDKPCDQRATIRYHFDAETESCLAFKYTGCGGNTNNFNSESNCYLECSPADHLNCPANSPPTLRPDGSADCDREKRKCPEGSSCEMGFAVGICCGDKNLEKYNANIRPDCGDRKVVLEDESEFAGTMLGKSCDHQFCPLGAECHRGTYFAYCCQ
uniref:BPTI/Kunitz inhibitor domain-containing protein n=1 Tax=Haemonchus contortus TaxID=6289 RepID=A0A7I4YW21_HAECO